MLVEQLVLWSLVSILLCVVGAKSNQRVLGFMGALLLIPLSFALATDGISFQTGTYTTYNVSGDGLSINQTSTVSYSDFNMAIAGIDFKNFLWLLVIGIAIYLMAYYAMTP